MAGLKEIKTRISSIKNTKKTTYAMKLVSTAKLARAQDDVKNGRTYTEALLSLLSQVLQDQDDDSLAHPLTTAHEEVKRVKLFVIGANKGLAGAYHSNLQKIVDKAQKDFADQGIEVDSVVFGRRQVQYYRNQELKASVNHEDLPDSPKQWPIDDVCTLLQEEFRSGSAQEVYMIYTKFKSAMSTSAKIEKILPMDEQSIRDEVASIGENTESGITMFKPDSEVVFSELLPRILRCRVRQACLDAKASEHGMRMAAMDNATKNAGELIDSLTLTYNKLRQAGITSQIMDIVGGANALD